MAKFRIEKKNNYTIISNNIFKNKLLSLKAKGLLCLMLSLPEDWDYTVAGLTTLNKDGRDSIASALKELEKHGYLVRNRLRNDHGRIVDIEYIIYEFPVSINETQPIPEKPEMVSSQAFSPIPEKPEVVSSQAFSPIPEKPESDMPTSGSPTTDMPQQLITENINTKINNLYNQSTITIDDLINTIKKQIDYVNIISFDSSLKPKCDELIEIIAETLLSNQKNYRVNNTDVSSTMVKSRFKKLCSADIYYIIDCLNNTTNTISNMRQYLFSALYNAPTTRAFYYTKKAQQNLSEGRKITC